MDRKTEVEATLGRHHDDDDEDGGNGSLRGLCAVRQELTSFV